MTSAVKLELYRFVEGSSIYLLTNFDGGYAYASGVADVLSVNHSFDSGAGSGFQITIATISSPSIDGSGRYIGPIATFASVVGGAGYTNGSYTNIPLTGGIGSGATVNFTVTSGVINSVVIHTAGTGYTAGTEQYVATTIQRSTIEAKNEINKQNVDISLQIDHTLAQKWLTENSETLVTATIFEVTDAGTEVAWKGRMASIKPSTADIAFTFESIFTSMRRPGVRQKFLRTCRFSLYRRGCNLNKDDFAVSGVPTAVSGLQVTVTAAASYADGYFNGGMLAAADGSLRYITFHSGSTLTLFRRSIPLETAFALGATTVTLYPGCDRARMTCILKFSNLPNYGGFDWIPVTNPFGGSTFTT